MSVFNIDNNIKKDKFDILKAWMILRINESVQEYISIKRKKFHLIKSHSYLSDTIKKSNLWDMITREWKVNKSFIIECGFEGNTRTEIIESKDPKYLYDIRVAVYTISEDCVWLINMPIINFAEQLLLTGEDCI